MEWWKTIAPDELDVDWLDPGTTTTIAATGSVELAGSDITAMYKMLANLAQSRRLPFTKSGRGKTSARLYSLATCVRLRFVFELARKSSFSDALLDESNAVCDWFHKQLSQNAPDFTGSRKLPEEYRRSFLLSQPQPDGRHMFVIGPSADISAALSKSFNRSLNMTISDIGSFLGAAAKRYVRLRTELILQNDDVTPRLLNALSISEEHMNAFARSAAARRLTRYQVQGGSTGR